MSSDQPDDPVTQYEARYEIYVAFARRLKELLESILENEKIDFHIVESRAKTVKSFKEKITRTDKDYKDPINQITDSCGCRVIAYYADDVTRIGDILEREFIVVEKELAHQPSSLEVDRFGYLSAHYIIKLSNVRGGLMEWGVFRELVAEVQIRTVIQHAWSAVSHALQYKREISVPSAIRRRLFRIAGLFELADEEFIGIREQRAAAQRSAEAQLAKGDLEIPLGTSSILEAVRTWSNSDRVRHAASTAGFLVRGDEGYTIKSDDALIPDIYAIAKKLNISNIKELLDHVKRPRMKYFKEVRDRKDGKGLWQASDDFLFVFPLVDKSEGKITKSFLVDELKWPEKTASRFFKPSE